MKRYILVFVLFLFSSAYAQNTINSYKYVIVPEKFGFQKEAGQYSLNTSTKQLLESKGFTVYFDNAEMPADIANNKCVALNADLTDKSGMFSTKLILTLKDCRGAMIFQSAVGTSREKEYSTGYTAALKDAFSSLEKVPYAYDGSNGRTGQSVAASPVVSNAPSPSPAPVPSAAPAKPIESTSATKTLYAQAIANGFQLIDTTPKKVMTLLKTSAENYFIANGDAVSGIVFKVGQDWVFEYYSNGKLVSEKLSIKF